MLVTVVLFGTHSFKIIPLTSKNTMAWFWIWTCFDNLFSFLMMMVLPSILYFGTRMLQHISAKFLAVFFLSWCENLRDHLAQTFFMLRSSCKILHAVSLSMFIASPNFWTLSWWYSPTIWLFFPTFSLIHEVEGHTRCSLYSTSCHSLVNLLYHSNTRIHETYSLSQKLQ